MWWYPGQDPHHEDLTAQTSAPLAFSHRPASHVFVDVTNQQSHPVRLLHLDRRSDGRTVVAGVTRNAHDRNAFAAAWIRAIQAAQYFRVADLRAVQVKGLS